MPKELRSALLQGGIVTGLMALALVIGCLLIPGHTEIPEDATTAPAPAPTIAPNPYTMDDFQYENGFLSCSAGKTVIGIDDPTTSRSSTGSRSRRRALNLPLSDWVTGGIPTAC